MRKKYQVFVSSTYIDLIDIRNIACQVILDVGQIPVGYYNVASVKELKKLSIQ